MHILFIFWAIHTPSHERTREFGQERNITKMTGGGDKKNEGSSDSELLSLVRRDVSGMSDDDLDRLVLETKLEASRRRKIPMPSPNTFKRWGVAFLLVVVALFILLKAETSAVESDSKGGGVQDKDTLAAPGEKGAWLGGDDPLDKNKKARGG